MFHEELLQSAFDWALRFYQRKGLNAQDAEDCAAEVRLHLLQHLQQGRPLSFAYAVQVARGILADFVQAQQQRPQAMPLEYADSHGWREPSSELRAAVRWALEQLTPDARALVWLHDVEGYTAEELTERFGCNAACLRQRLHRARKRLRELLR